jgi:hypothetical protein
MGGAPRAATNTGRVLAVQGISYAKLANLPPIIGLCEFSFHPCKSVENFSIHR